MGIDIQLIYAFLPAVVFFGMIPLIGAFAVRRRWRVFRKKLLRAAHMPRLDYAYGHSAYAHSREKNRTGNPGEAISDTLSDSEPVSFYGRLEGIQSKTGIWLGSKGISVAIDLQAVPIFLLPQSAEAAITPPDATPRVVYWKEMNALVEGSRIFVAGTLSRTGGTLVFRSWEAGQGVPLVIMYDCPDSSVFDRAMWTGRQRNEYWNHLTPISLIVGFLGELLWVIRIFEESRLSALVGIIGALVPILPLIPPGVVGFYLYRRLWRRGRRIRAARDVAALRAASRTTDGGGGGAAFAASAPTSRTTDRRTIHAAVHELLAMAALFIGIIVNAYIAAVILAILLR